MEIKFKNVTKCTTNLYNEFLRFHRKKYKTRDMFTFLIIAIAVIYMIAFNIKYHNYIFVLIILIGSILIFALNEKRQKKIVKKEEKSAKIQNQTEIEYYFYNRYYFVLKMNKQRKVIRYYKLYRVNSDSKNFYLYLDKTHALIVSKSGFVKGSPKEFKNFISKKCRFRYSK